MILSRTFKKVGACCLYGSFFGYIGFLSMYADNVDAVRKPAVANINRFDFVSRTGKRANQEFVNVSENRIRQICNNQTRAREEADRRGYPSFMVSNFLNTNCK